VGQFEKRSRKQMKSFKIGDVVTERNKIVPMTVLKVEGDSILCLWFVGTNLEEKPFPTSDLVLVND